MEGFVAVILTIPNRALKSGIRAQLMECKMRKDR